MTRRTNYPQETLAFCFLVPQRSCSFLYVESTFEMSGERDSQGRRGRQLQASSAEATAAPARERSHHTGAVARLETLPTKVDGVSANLVALDDRVAALEETTHTRAKEIVDALDDLKEMVRTIAATAPQPVLTAADAERSGADAGRSARYEAERAAAGRIMNRLSATVRKSMWCRETVSASSRQWNPTGVDAAVPGNAVQPFLMSILAVGGANTGRKQSRETVGATAGIVGKVMLDFVSCALLANRVWLSVAREGSTARLFALPQGRSAPQEETALCHFRRQVDKTIEAFVFHIGKAHEDDSRGAWRTVKEFWQNARPEEAGREEISELVRLLLSLKPPPGVRWKFTDRQMALKDAMKAMVEEAHEQGRRGVAQITGRKRDRDQCRDQSARCDGDREPSCSEGGGGSEALDQRSRRFFLGVIKAVGTAEKRCLTAVRKQVRKQFFSNLGFALYAMSRDRAEDAATYDANSEVDGSRWNKVYTSTLSESEYAALLSEAAWDNVPQTRELTLRDIATEKRWNSGVEARLRLYRPLPDLEEVESATVDANKRALEELVGAFRDLQVTVQYRVDLNSDDRAAMPAPSDTEGAPLPRSAPPHASARATVVPLGISLHEVALALLTEIGHAGNGDLFLACDRRSLHAVHAMAVTLRGLVDDSVLRARGEPVPPHVLKVIGSVRAFGVENASKRRRDSTRSDAGDGAEGVEDDGDEDESTSEPGGLFGMTNTKASVYTDGRKPHEDVLYGEQLKDLRAKTLMSAADMAILERERDKAQREQERSSSRTVSATNDNRSGDTVDSDSEADGRLAPELDDEEDESS